jgi:hypothetical protein
VSAGQVALHGGGVQKGQNGVGRVAVSGEQRGFHGQTHANGGIGIPA